MSQDPGSAPSHRRITDRIPRWLPAVADQGVVAIANLLISVLISRSGGIAALGAYAVISVTLLSCLGLTRTLVTDPWLARAHASRPADGAVSPSIAAEEARQSGAAGPPHEEASRMQSAVPQALRTLLLIAAFLTAVICLIAARAVSADPVWLLCGPIGAALVIQDAGRYGAYKNDRPLAALSTDSALLVAILAGGVGAWAFDVLTLRIVLSAWLLGLLTGVGLRAGEVIGRLAAWRATQQWWNGTCRSLALPLLGDSLAYFLCTNVTTYELALLATQREVGLVRVMLSLYSPVAILFTGLNMWLTPAMARRGRSEGRAFQRKAVLGLSLVAITITVLMTVAGPELGEVVYGPDARPDRVGFLLAGISVWFSAMTSPWLASVRVFGRYAPVAAARLTVGVASVVVVAAAPLFRSADTFMGVLTIQNAVVMVAAWASARKAHSARLADGPSAACS